MGLVESDGVCNRLKGGSFSRKYISNAVSVCNLFQDKKVLIHLGRVGMEKIGSLQAKTPL